MMQQLAQWQAAVNGAGDYPAMVARAKANWQSHRGTPALQMAEVLLSQMCGGGRRCCYCEDSLAHDIEHIWPKSLYPGLVFDWMNYIYACPVCNQAKGARFAICAPGGGLAHVNRPRGVLPTAPPPAGEMAFINPRMEDPMRFFILDLRGTFRLVVDPRLGGVDRQRAEYTLSALPLNDDALCWERRNEYGNYCARLEQYVRAMPGPAAVLSRRRDAILRLRHPTVWHEMQRQRDRLPSLRRLFQAAPDACLWRRP